MPPAGHVSPTLKHGGEVSTCRGGDNSTDMLGQKPCMGDGRVGGGWASHLSMKDICRNHRK